MLDLENSKIRCLPDEMGDLIHLKYLGLKHTDITELPPTLGNLRALQTLDIRWCGNITEFPAEILNLVNLRHLKMFKNRGLSGAKLPAGIESLRNLLTLTGISANGCTARELGDLLQLKKLRVVNMAEDEDNIRELFSSIMKMHNLLGLSLETKHTLSQKKLKHGELILLQSLSPPPLLEKLHLGGLLGKLPNWLGSLEGLRTLRLGYSHLTENPTGVVQLLPNLKTLTLWHAYDTKQIGKEFCRAGGFPRLEVLSIASHVLEEWTEIEEGAFPSLKFLNFHNCLQMQMLPEGLQFVTTLKQLNLLPLRDEHADRLRPDGGQENYKIRHIPRVSVITTSMVTRLVDDRTRET